MSFASEDFKELPIGGHLVSNSGTNPTMDFQTYQTPKRNQHNDDIITFQNNNNNTRPQLDQNTSKTVLFHHNEIPALAVSASPVMLTSPKK